MGGSTSGKGTTTSTSAPNPQASSDYLSLMAKAQKLSAQPYTPYTGQLVANLTPEQQTAFSEMGNAYGAAQPYLNQASQYATLGASPIQASAIQNYLNPYQQDVVGATEAQMNNVDQAQLASVMGQGMGSGGLFNDRLGVAQGQTVNQQSLANNQTLAGLNVQNYNQALSAAQADRAAAAQGAYTFGNLGQENLQSILAGAGAEYQAGSAEQAQQQNVLSSNYGQWQQAQAYPYQQLAYAAGIDTELGSNLGGTSTTTTPPPNPMGQYGGVGLAAAGMGYNMSQGNSAFAKKGGRILRGFDSGGTVPYGGASGAPYGSVPWIPNVQGSHGSGPPKPPSAPQQQAASMPKLPGGLGGKGGGTSAAADAAQDAAQDAAEGGIGSGLVDATGAAAEGGGFLADMAPALMLLANKGGRIDVGRPHGLEWGHVRGYADGGAPYQAVPAAMPGLADDPEDPDAPLSLGSGGPFGKTDPEAFSPGYFGVPPRRNALEGGTRTLAAMGPGTDFPFNPVRTSGNRADVDPDLTDPDGLHAPLEDGPGAPGKPTGETLEARGDAEPSRDKGSPAPPAGAPPVVRPDDVGQADGVASAPHRSNGLGNALMAAGFSMMGNRSPYFGVAAGEAGMAGLGAYEGTKRTEEAQRKEGVKEKLEQSKVDRQVKALEAQTARADRAQTETARHNAANEAHQAALMAQGKVTPGWRQKADGAGWEPIPGGPHDPAVIQQQQQAKVGPGMSPESKEVIARRMIAGDYSGYNSLGRTGAGLAVRNEINNLATELAMKENGMNPAQASDLLNKNKQEYGARQIGLNTEARTEGQRETNLNMILRAANAAIPAALEANDKLTRYGGPITPLNKIIQRGEIMTSNPELVEFGMANLQLAEHWARAMNPTGVMRESDRDKALSFLDTGLSAGTYKRAVMQLQKQIERERDSIHGKSPSAPIDVTKPAPQPGVAGPATPGSGATLRQPTITELNDAKSAIAQGRPRDAIIQRLQEHGISPSGL